MYTQIVLVQTGKWIQLYKKKFFKLIEFLNTFWAIELIVEHKLTYEQHAQIPFCKTRRRTTSITLLDSID